MKVNTVNSNSLNNIDNIEKITELYNKPFLDLVHKAVIVHKKHWKTNDMQLSTLLSIKTGACPEDCKYCAQSKRYNTNIKVQALMEVEEVKEKAIEAKKNGATRFCLGAAYRKPRNKDMDKLVDMVKEVKKLGLETCMTLGTLSKEHADRFATVGLDYYNHNIDTSPDYYKQIISTREFSERIDTLNNVRNAGVKLCSGGIIGMGESKKDRIKMLSVLLSLAEPPESVPINRLVPIPGTPLADVEPLDSFELVRTLATARIIFPKSRIRLAAGREGMSDELQALCFLVGVNSIFYGERLLTTDNAKVNKDKLLFDKLGIDSSIA